MDAELQEGVKLLMFTSVYLKHWEEFKKKRYNQTRLTSNLNSDNHFRVIKEHRCCSVAKPGLTLRPHGLQHARLPCPSLSARVCSNSCALSQ